MKKLKTSFLQQFAKLHGLKVVNSQIAGPDGQINEAHDGWFYFRPGKGHVRFNPITQAKKAIEAVGLPYTPPVEPIKKDRKEFQIKKTLPSKWYVDDKAGPFQTRELARIAREWLKNDRQNKPKKSN